MNPTLVGVSAAATLISAVSAVMTYLIRARGRERLAAIQGAAPGDKAKLVADAIAMFDIPVLDLSAEQRVLLVVEQLRDRDRQRGRNFALSIVLALVLAGATITLAAIGHAGPTPAPQAPAPIGAAAGPSAPAPASPEAKPAREVLQISGDHSVSIVGDHNKVSVKR